MGMSVSVSAATAADAEQLLKLQYLCYQQEALLYEDFTIDPLTQTLESIRTELASGTALVARLGDEIIASVRGHVDPHDGVGRINRLIVHPRMQRHGLGSRLLRAMEHRLAEEHGGPLGYRLSTGHRSAGNLRLYQRLGYRPVGTRDVNRRLRMVTLEKPAEGAETAEPLAATA